MPTIVRKYGCSTLAFSHFCAFLQGYANGVNPLQLLTFQITSSIRPCHVAAFCKADFECLSAEPRCLTMSGIDRCFFLCCYSICCHCWWHCCHDPHIYMEVKSLGKLCIGDFDTRLFFFLSNLLVLALCFFFLDFLEKKKKRFLLIFIQQMQCVVLCTPSPGPRPNPTRTFTLIFKCTILTSSSSLHWLARISIPVAHVVLQSTLH